MMKPTFQKINFILFLLLNSHICFSQTYSGSAKLEKIKKDGFYSIILKPEIVAKLKDNFSDIRIIDSKGIETPYILDSDVQSYHSTYFKEYQIYKIITKSSSYVTIKNESEKYINNISIEVKNSDVIKLSKVLGSDDGKQWFAIKSLYLFQNENNTNSPVTMNVINFPLSNYKFFKLQFSDYFEAPINIIRAGYFETKIEYGKYIELTKPTIIQTDSSKIHASFISISFPDTIIADRLEFSLAGPKFFVREAELGYFETNAKKETKFISLQNITLKSNQYNAFDLSPAIKRKKIILWIKNENNPVLKINSIKGYQLTKYLKSYLSMDENYTLLFGNKNAEAPIYDLAYFTDSIPGIIPNCALNSVNFSTLKSLKPTQSNTKWYENNYLIWGVLISVLILMIFVVYSMMKDMKTKEV